MIITIAILAVALAGTAFGVGIGFGLYYFGAWIVARCFSHNGDAPR